MIREENLDPALVRFLKENGLHTVEGAFEFEGGEDLSKPGLGRRRRTRIKFRDEQQRLWEMYLKRYSPRPWWQRLWRLLTFRAARSVARREYRNVQAVREAGVATMRDIAYGAAYDMLGVTRSYLIVSAVPGQSLERIGNEFLSRHMNDPAIIRELTETLTSLVRTLHGAGLCHRDLYACHLFLHEHDGRVELYLIDLARVFRPRWRPFRWRVKDLAQLKYSMPWIWVQECWEGFLSGYLQTDHAGELDRWGRAIDRKVLSMERQQNRRERRARRRAERKGQDA
jgi:tRNA A-37 threonylcarbamoyl transferase component Bud32